MGRLAAGLLIVFAALALNGLFPREAATRGAAGALVSAGGTMSARPGTTVALSGAGS